MKPVQARKNAIATAIAADYCAERVRENLMELVRVARRTVVAKTSVDSDVSVEFQAGELFQLAATNAPPVGCRSRRRASPSSHPGQ